MEQHIGMLGYDVVIPHDFAEDDAEKFADSVSRDFSFLDSCDILLAEVSKTSHGVGMEILHAHRSGKRVVLMMRAGTKLSSMARAHAHEVLEYEDMNDLKTKLAKILNSA